MKWEKVKPPKRKISLAQISLILTIAISSITLILTLSDTKIFNPTQVKVLPPIVTDNSNELLEASKNIKYDNISNSFITIPIDNQYKRVDNIDTEWESNSTRLLYTNKSNNASIITDIKIDVHNIIPIKEGRLDFVSYIRENEIDIFTVNNSEIDLANLKINLFGTLNQYFFRNHEKHDYYYKLDQVLNETEITIDSLSLSGGEIVRTFRLDIDKFNSLDKFVYAQYPDYQADEINQKILHLVLEVIYNQHSYFIVLNPINLIDSNCYSIMNIERMYFDIDVETGNTFNSEVFLPYVIEKRFDCIDVVIKPNKSCYISYSISYTLDGVRQSTPKEEANILVSLYGDYASMDLDSSMSKYSKNLYGSDNWHDLENN